MNRLEAKVAYFTMEVGLRHDIPTYSGGLGILSGDHLKSAADLGIPMIGVSLMYNFGYFRQTMENGWQRENFDQYNPRNDMIELHQRTTIPIEGRNVKVKPWLYEIKGRKGTVPVIFLDTNDGLNPPYDAEITHKLYRADDAYWRICQEVLLGVGGVRMLAEMGINPEVYHLNEGHGAFATLELARQFADRDAAWKKTVFTTHTPVEAGHDRLPYDKVRQVLGDYLPNNIADLAGHDKLNMTKLAVSGSRYINAVAKRHAEVSQQMDVFAGKEVDSITNGVHSETWTGDAFQNLYDTYLPGWRDDPSILLRADNIPLRAIETAHFTQRMALLDYVEKTTGHKLNPKVLTIGSARRFAEYKRGNMPFYNVARLLEFGNGRVQFVFAGKAHPNDSNAKWLIKNITDSAAALKGKVDVVFVPNYNMESGKILTSGADVWMNMPKLPLEASGTSGMKAAHNGVMHLSTDDGWWPEANGGGWTFGVNVKSGKPDIDSETAGALYSSLEHLVIPTFEGRLDETARLRQQAIKNAAFFNTHRMVQEYFDKAYKIGVHSTQNAETAQTATATKS